MVTTIWDDKSISCFSHDELRFLLRESYLFLTLIMKKYGSSKYSYLHSLAYRSLPAVGFDSYESMDCFWSVVQRLETPILVNHWAWGWSCRIPQTPATPKLKNLFGNLLDSFQSHISIQYYTGLIGFLERAPGHSRPEFTSRFHDMVVAGGLAGGTDLL